MSDLIISLISIQWNILECNEMDVRLNKSVSILLSLSRYQSRYGSVSPPCSISLLYWAHNHRNLRSDKTLRNPLHTQPQLSVAIQYSFLLHLKASYPSERFSVDRQAGVIGEWNWAQGPNSWCDADLWRETSTAWVSGPIPSIPLTLSGSSTVHH
jgi:hypothetical protein